MPKHKLPETPEYYSVDEMCDVWAEHRYWQKNRRDAQLPELRKLIRGFREENEGYGRERRKKYLIDCKTMLTEKILEHSDHVDLMDIPPWEKRWLMEPVRSANKRIKKINGELRYVYGTPKGSIDDEDIRRAKEVDIMGLDLIANTRRSGYGRHTAPCLWHDEKTGSMTIYSGGKGVHCFGCGKSGSTIDIVMKVLNLNFVDAVKYLRGK